MMSIGFATGGLERVRIDGSGNVQLSSGFLLLPQGTSTTPSLSFSGDTDTGIFAKESNILAFSTGGVERMRIDGSGNVQLSGFTLLPQGTSTTPSLTFANDTDTGIFAKDSNILAFSTGGTERLRLDSSGNALFTGFAFLPSGTSTTPSLAFTDDTDTGLFSKGNNILVFTTGGTERLRVDGGGNVGIGTTSPLALLDVNGVSAAGLGAVGAPSFAFRTNLNTGMWSSGTNTVNFSTGGSERMRIDSSGNVGIGTASPASLLHIALTTTFSATGGTITTSGGYTIHTFTSSGTFTPNGAGTVEYLVVGGGGGGGSLSENSVGAGGGGAGGFRTATGFAVTAQAYTITVGAGGSGAQTPTNGSDSVFGTITATGGGRGGYRASGAYTSGGNGGSGGGGISTSATPGGTGTSGQGFGGGNGNSGNAGGGGGGAGAVGTNSSTNAGDGGAGIASSISGASVTYAGGGGGGIHTTGSAGAGGSGGGGAGGAFNSTGNNATANTGGGGGGSGSGSGGTYPSSGGNGGSGIVIIRYLTNGAPLFNVLSTGNVGIGTATPGSKLSVAGTIESTSGGVKFPDATTQTTAATAQITTVRKTVDETVNNSATLQNDDELFLPMAANETWFFNLFIQHIGNSTADFKLTLTVPSGATINWNFSGVSYSEIDAFAVTDSVTTSGGSPGVNPGATNTGARIVPITGVVINGSTAGNLQLQWAQNTATAVDTKVLTNSYLEAHK
ncbi:MAG: hypothetical protein HY001_04835 [Candidatus Portnoybacteria bacterium]|nr:hypothetical protein [Candidatus Portnoybacteria bacterium]